jgi:hypothetical protein
LFLRYFYADEKETFQALFENDKAAFEGEST